MISKTKRFAGLAAAVLAVSAGLPANTAGAAAVCTAVSQSTGSEVAVVLEGHYKWPKSNTADVRLTCHLVQNGVKVVSITDPLPGSVAALVSDQRIGTDPFTVCYSIYVTERAFVPPYPTDFYSATTC